MRCSQHSKKPKDLSLLEQVRQNSDGVLQLVRNNKFQEAGLGY